MQLTTSLLPIALALWHPLLAAGDPAATADTSPCNYFINPGPQGNDNFIPNEIIHVAFKTDYKKPYLSLFCGNLAQAVLATTNVTVKEGGVGSFDLPGQDTNAVPNCYFQMQDGIQTNPAAQPSFGTGIFAIGNGEADAGGSGRVLNATQECCKCPA
ncbi:MAG: hypothetical protein Q9168_004352 [Polycauliona sp. 1 TL-2023]